MCPYFLSFIGCGYVSFDFNKHALIFVFHKIYFHLDGSIYTHAQVIHTHALQSMFSLVTCVDLFVLMINEFLLLQILLNKFVWFVYMFLLCEQQPWAIKIKNAKLPCLKNRNNLE